MSQFISKEGVYEKDTITEDVPTSKYKPYEYTQECFIGETYLQKIPCFYIEDTDQTISLQNGVLSFKGVDTDITQMKISEVINLLLNVGLDVRTLGDVQYMYSLPALLLPSFSNCVVHKLDGDISPLNYINYLPKNKTIYETNSSIVRTDVIDIETNTPKQCQVIDDTIFYSVSKTTKIYIKQLSTSFYVFVDFSAKQIKNGNTIANLREKLYDNSIGEISPVN